MINMALFALDILFHANINQFDLTIRELFVFSVLSIL
jgi:hypothetical protein